MEALFEDLKGKILSRINKAPDNSTLQFICEDGTMFEQYHDGECCESVLIEDICGDLDDLLNLPILLAEEVIHENENPQGVIIPQDQDSFTWTFYKLATIRGYVTIRWYGESNGYYSERVNFRRIAVVKGE